VTDSATARRAFLARIEANVRAVAARGRDVVDVGPFRAFLSPSSANYLLSVAVPVTVPTDWSAGIVALDAAFAARGRRPRLEILHDLYPTLGDALEAAGYDHTMRAPVMVLSPEAFFPRASEPGAAFVALSAEDDAAIDAFLAMQNRAYALAFEEADVGWRPILQEGLAAGTIMAGAIAVDGVIASGATLLVGGGAAELAGVGTVPESRRRGLAALACGRLLEAFFDGGGDLCWLSAAEDARGLYEQLGFRTVGEQRNYGRAPR
jgi:ribosomal protein S18 acetylase RimI-like enzyme